MEEHDSRRDESRRLLDRCREWSEEHESDLADNQRLEELYGSRVNELGAEWFAMALGWSPFHKQRFCRNDGHCRLQALKLVQSMNTDTNVTATRVRVCDNRDRLISSAADEVAGDSRTLASLDNGSPAAHQ